MTPTTAELQAWQRVVGATADGKPGPDTFARTVAWFRDHGFIAPPVIATSGRDAVVNEALLHVGQWSEKDVDDLWREVGCPDFAGHWHDKAWCGGFALRCLRRALGVNWTWKDQVGFAIPHGMPQVSLPEVGDVAYFAKNSHYAIVQAVGNGHVALINGNGMTAPAEGVVINSKPLLARDGGPSTYFSIRNIVP